MSSFRSAAADTPEKPSLAFRRLWYDTVGHNHVPALRAAAEGIMGVGYCNLSLGRMDEARAAFDEAISRNLQVMDGAAFALCRDQKLPIKVFRIFKAGALKRVVMGEDEGTLVHV